MKSQSSSSETVNGTPSGLVFQLLGAVPQDVLWMVSVASGLQEMVLMNHDSTQVSTLSLVSHVSYSTIPIVSTCFLLLY